MLGPNPLLLACSDRCPAQTPHRFEKLLNICWSGFVLSIMLFFVLDVAVCINSRLPFTTTADRYPTEATFAIAVTLVSWLFHADSCCFRTLLHRV